MFKNSQHDPLAVPEAVQRRSAGPSFRTADSGGLGSDIGNYNNAVGVGPLAGGVTDPTGGVLGETAMPGINPAPNSSGGIGEMGTSQNSPDVPQQGHVGIGNGVPTTASIPRKVAITLDREARAFMDREGTTDDRQELLYRARRHARTQTSTWGPDASAKLTEAFCGRVAALIPSLPRVAAAQPVTEFADFDDQLLY